MASRETFVQREQHRIYVRDHPGAEPAIILMHGFPDNVHLYDRLSPYLSPPRRVVLFDFLGWGSSDKPSGYPYTTDNQVGTSTPSSSNWGSGKTRMSDVFVPLLYQQFDATPSPLFSFA
jgi:pimeloyl-ACP methyl ester carboxylesterase